MLLSAIFQRPLCDLGAAYDHAFRPVLGEAEAGTGGPCDDRPHRTELLAATASSPLDPLGWRAFSLCPEHEAQLRCADARLTAGGRASRFRGGTGRDPTAGSGRR